MSSSSTVTMKCPVCGKETDVRIWNSVNASLNPEMKNRIKDGTAFRHACPFCGKTSNLDYSFLYHDMEKKLMVYYVDSEEAAAEVAEYFDQDIGGEMGYALRIVGSIDELREKIHIFDAGYDDRIIEIIKVFYYTQLLEQDPDFDSELMFFRTADGLECFQMVGGKGDYNGLELPEGFCRSVGEEFLPRLAGNDCGYAVNQRWALDFLNNNAE